MTNDLSAITGGGATAQATAPRAGSLGGLASQKDQFLKLLLAQLKNQDPLQPPDASKFSQEMIQFGQLEQLFNLNSTMEQVAKLNDSGQRSQAISLIGKEVDLRGDIVEVVDGSAATLGFQLTQPSEGVTAQIVDVEGKVVRKLDFGTRDAGTHFVKFDGKGDDGEPLPAGHYGVQYIVDGGPNAQRIVSPLMRGTVSGVQFETDGVWLRVGERRIPMTEVVGVHSA